MSDDYSSLIDRLSAHRRILITTHVRPDGDALGTSAAMHMGMKTKGIDSEVLLLSHLPRKYAFIFDDNQVPYHDAEADWPAGLELDAFDALLVCDTGTWSQLPGLKERVLAWPKPKYVLDHHLTQEDWPTAHLVDTGAAAAGEIATELLERWDIPITPAIAAALFLAIVSDTGWFHFANTTPHTLRMAADLLEAGVDRDRSYELLYYNERAERVALQTRAMQSLQLQADGRLATLQIRRQDFADTGGSVSDTENVINLPLAIRTVEVSLLFTETPDPGPIKVSLRSKGGVDVARFAEQFGGGGHARAAGLKIEGSLADAHRQVSTAMLAALRR